MNQYEALYILDTKGADDSVPEIIERIEKEIAALGGNVQGVQKMDRRKFERGDHRIDSGFYVNIRFGAPPSAIDALRKKFEHSKEIFRQLYMRARAIATV